ncbi:Lysine--tRNA ligase [Candidatus Hepatincola sp. Av]
MDSNLGLNAKSWPFLEAKKILKHINNQVPKKGYVLFETGYGPSGLPHIGTFGEVARTSMVRFAFQQISDIPTKLIAFSDDLDGLRKVPTNIPNQDKLQAYLGKPLTKVLDPFGEYPSFGEYNNAKLQEFLNRFGFEYEFYSSTKCYHDGLFNDALLKVLEHYNDITKIILPTLGQDRQATYSPFLPISKKTGNVLQVPVVAKDVKKGTIIYIDEDNHEVETKVTDGACKLQWKVDWAMRWYALDVDYEMSGKDLIPSVELAAKICRVLGKKPPQSLTYELFLDKNGEKISKSKGNGLSIEDWLRYGNQDSLTYYMYQKPQTAKRLFFDVIPRSVDEWLQHLANYYNLSKEEQYNNPLYFVHQGNPPQGVEEITFTLLLQLIAVVSTEDKEVLMGFVSKYKEVNEETRKIVEELLDYAKNYYQDFIKPQIKYRELNKEEARYLERLEEELKKLSKGATGKDIQKEVYAVGLTTGLELKEWFKLLYESLLGQSEGPRIGTFFALYGLDNSLKLIQKAIHYKVTEENVRIKE